MDSKNYGIFLLYMLTLFNCGALFFLVGFFPDASNSGDLIRENKDNRPSSMNGLRVTPPQRQHDQIILMIIDALRYDFMNMIDYLPSTHEKSCKILKLQVAVPTVTMPRIKSLMTGTLSNFIDIIRNLGEAEQLTDSLVHALKRRGDMINFAGDRTWEQLFPNEFTRKTANNDSLYVQDFYKGDMQVKEELKKEINQTDWSLLILHFLGLDHIGHVEGSNSIKIPGKLLEMDKNIRDIYENKHFKNRLLLVTGDHGMRNGGGHGGSTEEEINVPLVFFTENCKRNSSSKRDLSYNQIDLAPTLAILFSVEIPKASIGCLIPELLINLTYEENLYAFFYNAQHLMNKTIAKYGENDAKRAGYSIWYRNAKIAHRHFLEAKMKNMSAGFHYEQALAEYKRIAENISSRLSESLVTFDNILISVGLFLTSTVTIYMMIFTLFAGRKSFLRHRRLNKKQTFLSLIVAIMIVVAIARQSVDVMTILLLKKYCFCVPFIAVATYIACNILKAVQKLILPVEYKSPLQAIWCFPIPLIVCYFITTFLLVSSSYIEYEELSSHYLGCTCLILLFIKTLLQRVRAEFDAVSNSKKRFFLIMRNTKSEILLWIIILFTLRLFRKPQDSFLNDLEWFQSLKKNVVGLHFPLGILLLLGQISKLTTTHQMFPCALALFSVFSFRVIEGQMPFIPPFKISPFIVLILFWVCIKITVLLEFKSFVMRKSLLKFLQTFLACILLTTVLLQKPKHIILVPSLLFVLDKIYSICDNLKLKIPEQLKQNYVLAYKTLMTIFMANMFFFYQGNTNSLATVDLNPGFIGQSSYNPIIAVIFLTMNTYAAPIISFIYLVLHILKKPIKIGTNINVTSSDVSATDDNGDLRHVLSLYATAIMLPTSVYLALMIFFRYHLFIYSVFAPKFFYECYDVLVFYIVYLIIYLILHLFKKI